MENPGGDASAKFISALIKSVQTLCHGYLEFQNGIEIIGHINLSVDKGNSRDYILKEKVCKNDENSTVFISNSFHAEPKSEQEVPVRPETNNQTVQNSDVTDSGDGSRVSSAISSISSALTGVRDRHRGSYGAKDSNTSHSHHRTAKRRASSDQSGDVCPAKVPSYHDGSHLSSDSPYHPSSGSPVDSKLGLQNLQTADVEGSETMLPQTANVPDNSDIGVNLAGSVLEPVENQSHSGMPDRDDDSDGDLEVTFIKEEYVEGERGACDFDNSAQQYVGGPHDRNSEGIPDPSVFPVALHSSSAPSTYVPSAHDPNATGQQFPGGGPSQPQPGPSGTRGAEVNIRRCGGLSDPASLDASGHSTLQSLSHCGAPSFGDSLGQISTPNSKYWKCKYCEAVFSSYSELLGHTNSIHLNRQQYVCNICGKGFSQSEHYNDHMNMHYNVKAHLCVYCSAAFTYKTNLRRHLRSGVCKKFCE